MAKKKKTTAKKKRASTKGIRIPACYMNHHTVSRELEIHHTTAAKILEFAEHRKKASLMVHGAGIERTIRIIHGDRLADAIRSYVANRQNKEYAREGHSSQLIDIADAIVVVDNVEQRAGSTKWGGAR